MASVLVHEGTHGLQQRSSIAATGGVPNLRRHLVANEVFARIAEYHYARGSGSDALDRVNDKTGGFNKEKAYRESENSVKAMCSAYAACGD
jgi:hypothetical protein